jgi:hypothetical protein
MRAGRKRKIGHRFASGKLRGATHKCPGRAAVYVIEIADGLVKIGVTASTRSRAMQIDRLHENSALVCCFWMEETEARRLEKAIHAEFKGKPFHASGEKYYLDAETAIAMIKARLGSESEIVGLERFDLTPEKFDCNYRSSTGMTRDGYVARTGRRKRYSPGP